jgi:hypothetical protein
LARCTPSQFAQAALARMETDKQDSFLRTSLIQQFSRRA